jgi:hypothetical protein
MGLEFILLLIKATATNTVGWLFFRASRILSRTFLAFFNDGGEEAQRMSGPVKRKTGEYGVTYR